MPEKNTTVNVNGVVENKLKLAAEAFAVKVFENKEVFEDYPHVLEAAVSVYEHSIESKPLTPIQNFN